MILKVRKLLTFIFSGLLNRESHGISLLQRSEIDSLVAREPYRDSVTQRDIYDGALTERQDMSSGGQRRDTGDGALTERQDMSSGGQRRDAGDGALTERQ